jgi:hypothetical protein
VRSVSIRTTAGPARRTASATNELRLWARAAPGPEINADNASINRGLAKVMPQLQTTSHNGCNQIGSKVNQLFPLLYLSCMVVLLWQAFRVMGKGFISSQKQPQITIHPEMLDKNGNLTTEELLTVRFSGDNEPLRADDRAS